MLQFFPDIWDQKKKKVYWCLLAKQWVLLDEQVTNPPIEKVHSEGLLQ